jgi:hypothetical protein
VKFVSDWRKAWRWFSVQMFALQGIVAASWLSVPDDMRAAVPSEWLAIAAVVLTALGILGRLVKQGGGDDKQG